MRHYKIKYHKGKLYKFIYKIFHKQLQRIKCMHINLNHTTQHIKHLQQSLISECPWKIPSNDVKRRGVDPHGREKFYAYQSIVKVKLPRQKTKKGYKACLYHFCKDYDNEKFLHHNINHEGKLKPENNLEFMF